MYGWDKLKKKIELTKKTVECPVENCSKEVCRKYREDKHKDEDRFRCPIHKILDDTVENQWVIGREESGWLTRHGPLRHVMCVERGEFEWKMKSPNPREREESTSTVQSVMNTSMLMLTLPEI